jgi:ssDNA-binding Zn-finger/Zn-ribbon topoisomerase 1
MAGEMYGVTRGGVMDEFRVCPTCEYTRGFHASFRKDPEGVRIVFICPECGSSFDLGIIDSLVNDLKPKRGADY